MRIHLLWLPTCALWTKPMETLWRWLQQALLPHPRRADRWKQLTPVADAFLAQFAPGSTAAAAVLRYVGLLLN